MSEQDEVTKKLSYCDWRKVTLRGCTLDDVLLWLSLNTFGLWSESVVCDWRDSSPWWFSDPHIVVLGVEVREFSDNDDLCVIPEAIVFNLREWSDRVEVGGRCRNIGEVQAVFDVVWKGMGYIGRDGFTIEMGDGDPQTRGNDHAVVCQSNNQDSAIMNKMKLELALRAEGLSIKTADDILDSASKAAESFYKTGGEWGAHCWANVGLLGLTANTIGRYFSVFHKVGLVEWKGVLIPSRKKGIKSPYPL